MPQVRKVFRMDNEIDKITIRLGWPAKELSPNWRGHWSKKARAAKRYRFESLVLSQAAIIEQSPRKKRLQWKRGSIVVTVRSPNNRMRDLDNVLASLKPAIDGLVDAGLFVDDSQIEFTIRRGDAVKGGLIVIEAECR